MTDIVERAEAALRDEKSHPQRPWAAQGHAWTAAAWRAIELIPDLINELKAARAEAEQWKAHWRQNTETASVAIRERDEAIVELAFLIEADDD